MKPNTTIKTLCAAVALAVSAVASAGQIYLDNGNSATAGDNAYTPTPTSTSIKDELNLDYQSVTTLNFLNNTFSTVFGWNQAANNGNLGSNAVTGFDPTQTGLSTSNNGYGINFTANDWLLSFTGTASGTFTGSTIANLVLSYSTGHIDMFYIDPNLPLTGGTFAYTNFMDVNITGGQSVVGNTYLTGLVDFTGATVSTQNDLFHSVYKPSCAASDSFQDIVAGCGDEAPVFFTGDFNTYGATLGAGAAPYLVTVSGDHVGSVSFDVPEPASLALLGMGLVGLGAIRRRKTAA